MTNKEYVSEGLIDRLKQMIEQIETYKSSEANFDNDAEICDIADSVCYLEDCKKCPIDKFCNHFTDEESCFSNWWRYLQTEGDKEHEKNII